MTRYLAMQLVLRVDPKLTELTRQRLDRYSVTLKDWLISHLAEKSLDDVRGKDRLEQLKREIREQFTSTLFPEGDAEIKDILFSDFMVQ
jgi:flagellar basal body-associated protein FliL